MIGVGHCQAAGEVEFRVQTRHSRDTPERGISGSDFFKKEVESLSREVAEVVFVTRNDRAPGRFDSLKQLPMFKPCHARLMNVVRDIRISLGKGARMALPVSDVRKFQSLYEINHNHQVQDQHSLANPRGFPSLWPSQAMGHVGHNDPLPGVKLLL